MQTPLRSYSRIFIVIAAVTVSSNTVLASGVLGLQDTVPQNRNEIKTKPPEKSTEVLDSAQTAIETVKKIKAKFEKSHQENRQKTRKIFKLLEGGKWNIQDISQDISDEVLTDLTEDEDDLYEYNQRIRGYDFNFVIQIPGINTGIFQEQYIFGNFVGFYKSKKEGSVYLAYLDVENQPILIPSHLIKKGSFKTTGNFLSERED